MTRFIALLAALSLLALAGPAAAFVDDDLEIEFVESTVYFTPGTTGVSNVDAEAGEVVGWDAAEPSGTQGVAIATAHAGLLSLFNESAYERQSFQASGTVTGYVENMAVNLYYASPTDNLCGMGVSIDLTVDGIPVMDMEGIGNTEDVATYAEGDYYVTDMGLVNIHEAMVDAGIEGDETTEHTIDLLVQQYPLCQEAVWTYGSADAPSSITFNVDPDSSTYRFLTKFDVTNPPRPAA